jgi:hypothetical protein
MTTFVELAERCDIALPDALGRLFADGKTRYGTDTADWQRHWRTYLLAGEPALCCVYDYEWLNPERAAAVVDSWLSPAHQDGRKFLPFARSGAGDAYCLTPTPDGRIGVARIWHDKEYSSVDDASFAAFAYRLLVESAWDCEHLLGEDLSIDEARTCVIADMRSVAPYLPDALGTGLRQLIELALRPANHPDDIITEPQAEAALAILPDVEKQPFPIRPRWECRAA